MANSVNAKRSVFINCSFGPNFRPLFHAITFAVVNSGFVPRSALEFDDSGATRIARLYELINDCRLGIHDISRTELDCNGLPRFNMPFELGLFVGASEYGRRKRKKWLILDRKKYRYQMFLSDVAGFDPRAHGDKPEEAIVEVRNFLRSKTEKKLPGGRSMAEDYRKFELELPTMAAEHNLRVDDLLFDEIRGLMAKWLREFKASSSP